MHSSFFHAQRLGYRQNPFGALEADEWTAVAFLPAPVEAAINRGFNHLQLLGPKGIGKSSTLHRLRSWAGKQSTVIHFEYIPDGQRKFFTDLNGECWFLLDEAQRLNGRFRRRWLAALEGVQASKTSNVRTIFTSHIDLTAAFQRHKLDLTSVDLRRAVNSAYYQRWIDQRLQFFALPQTPTRLGLTPEAAAWLFKTFGLDLREAEYFLYEVWQKEHAPGILPLSRLIQHWADYRQISNS